MCPARAACDLGIHRRSPADRHDAGAAPPARAAPRRAPGRGSGLRRGRRRCRRSTDRRRSRWPCRCRASAMPRARATRRPIVLLPAPGGPMTTARGVSGSGSPRAHRLGDRRRGMPRGCAPSRSPSRRRTSRRTPGRARARPSPRPPPRRPGPHTRRTAGGSPWRPRTGRMSTVSSARGTVEIGFMAARTRSTSPVDMPPSVPPARPVRRRMAPSAARSISSWAADPRRAAVRKPSPTSTPLIAWIPMRAAASWASSLRSQCTCEPRPGGSP